MQLHLLSNFVCPTLIIFTRLPKPLRILFLFESRLPFVNHQLKLNALCSNSHCYLLVCWSRDVQEEADRNTKSFEGAVQAERDRTRQTLQDERVCNVLQSQHTADVGASI